jgi:hypothetical protein
MATNLNANSGIGEITLQWNQLQNTPDYTIAVNGVPIGCSISRTPLVNSIVGSVPENTDSCSVDIPINRSLAGIVVTFSLVNANGVITIKKLYWVDGSEFYDTLFVPMTQSEVSAVCNGTVRQTTDLIMNLQSQERLDKWILYVRGITTVDILVGSVLSAIANRLDTNPIRNLGSLPQGDSRIPTLLYQLSQDSETGITGLFKNISLLTSTRDAHRLGWAMEWAVNPTSIDITYDRIIAWTVQHAKYLTKALDIIETDLSPDITGAIIRACRSITTANPE